MASKRTGPKKPAPKKYLVQTLELGASKRDLFQPGEALDGDVFAVPKGYSTMHSWKRFAKKIRPPVWLKAAPGLYGPKVKRFFITIVWES